MPTVDFVYDDGCPNVRAARANLIRAFSRAGIAPRWSEHQIGARAGPPHVRGFGSPTILVDGVDVVGLAPGAEECCRLYHRGGVPAVGVIVAALEHAKNAAARSREFDSSAPDAQAAKTPPAEC